MANGVWEENLKGLEIIKSGKFGGNFETNSWEVSWLLFWESSALLFGGNLILWLDEVVSTAKTWDLRLLLAWICTYVDVDVHHLACAVDNLVQAVCYSLYGNNRTWLMYIHTMHMQWKKSCILHDIAFIWDLKLKRLLPRLKTQTATIETRTTDQSKASNCGS